MLKEIFVHIFNMSITSGYVIIAVLLYRFTLFKGAPKKYLYYAWSAVGFRLAVPVSFKSFFSMFSVSGFFNMDGVQSSGNNTLTYVPHSYEFSSSEVPHTNLGMPQTDIEILDRTTYNINSLFDKIFVENCDIFKNIWLAGFVLILIYGISSYVILRIKMANSVIKTDNIYESDKITSPFILGFVFPKIYIPFGLDEKTYRYVIAHEKCHLKRYDYYIKAFAFVLLAVHWFNPLCWIAFSLMTKDMEMSCDEKVLSDNDGIRKEYSSALLSFATERRIYAVTPLCFGEENIKQRIKNILKFKKPEIGLSVIFAVLCVGIIVFCCANPADREKNNSEVADVPENMTAGDFNDGALTFDEIENLLDIIESSPAYSSAPGDYINAHSTEYNTLLNNKSTVDYIYTEFLKGGNYDLKGQIMRCLLEGIAPDEKIDGQYETGQDYFDAFYNHNLELYKQNGYDYLKNNCSYGFKLLNMRGDIAPRFDVSDSNYLIFLEDTLRNNAVSKLESGSYADALQSLTGCLFEGDIGSGLYIYKFVYNENIYFTYTPSQDSITIYYNDEVYNSFYLQRVITDFSGLDILKLDAAKKIAYDELQNPAYSDEIRVPYNERPFADFAFYDKYKPVLYKHPYLSETEKTPEYAWYLVSDKGAYGYIVFMYIDAETGEVLQTDIHYNN